MPRSRLEEILDKYVRELEAALDDTDVLQYLAEAMRTFLDLRRHGESDQLPGEQPMPAAQRERTRPLTVTGFGQTLFSEN